MSAAPVVPLLSGGVSLPTEFPATTQMAVKSEMDRNMVPFSTSGTVPLLPLPSGLNNYPMIPFGPFTGDQRNNLATQSYPPPSYSNYTKVTSETHQQSQFLSVVADAAELARNPSPIKRQKTENSQTFSGHSPASMGYPFVLRPSYGSEMGGEYVNITFSPQIKENIRRMKVYMDGIEVELGMSHEFKTLPRRSHSEYSEITISAEMQPNPETSDSFGMLHARYPAMTISLPFKYVQTRTSPGPKVSAPIMEESEESLMGSPESTDSEHVPSPIVNHSVVAQHPQPHIPQQPQQYQLQPHQQLQHQPKPRDPRQDPTEAFFERLKAAAASTERRNDPGVQLQDEPRPFQRFCDMDISKRYLRTENGSGEFVVGLHPDLKGVGHVEVRLFRKGAVGVSPRDCSQHLITYDQNGTHRENLRTHTPLHAQKGIFRLGVSKKAGRDFYSLRFIVPLQDGTSLICETQNFRVSSNYQRKAKKE